MKDLNNRCVSGSVRQQLLFERQDQVSWNSLPVEAQDAVTLRTSELLEDAVVNLTSKKESAHE